MIAVQLAEMLVKHQVLRAVRQLRKDQHRRRIRPVFHHVGQAVKSRTRALRMLREELDRIVPGLAVHERAFHLRIGAGHEARDRLLGVNQPAGHRHFSKLRVPEIRRLLKRAPKRRRGLDVQRLGGGFQSEMY